MKDVTGGIWERGGLCETGGLCPTGGLFVNCLFVNGLFVTGGLWETSGFGLGLTGGRPIPPIIAFDVAEFTFCRIGATGFVITFFVAFGFTAVLFFSVMVGFSTGFFIALAVFFTSCGFVACFCSKGFAGFFSNVDLAGFFPSEGFSTFFSGWDLVLLSIVDLLMCFHLQDLPRLQVPFQKFQQTFSGGF